MTQHCVEWGYRASGSWDECPDCGWIPYWERETDADREHVLEVRLTDPSDSQIEAWKREVALLAENYEGEAELRTRDLD